MVSGNISESPDHKIKLEYESKEGFRILLWEPKRESKLLQTVFDGSGAIMDQRLFNAESINSKALAEAFMSKNGIEPKESVYEPVKLKAQCPSCNGASLVRYAETISDASKIPVMPIYMCTECGNKSYYMTDAYLKSLINSKQVLFEPKDMEEFKSNEQKFINELKAYIVRIFASKHILSIKNGV